MKNGIYTDLSIKDYHGNKSHFSSTQIRIAKRSLSEFHWNISGKITREEKNYFDFGNAFELALMDKVAFSEEVAIVPDRAWVQKAMESNPDLKKPRASKVYQDLEKEFNETVNGQYRIMDYGNHSNETIMAMIESCYKDSVIQRLIKNIDYQVSLFWTDPETGLNLKTRPDICKVKNNVVVNIKTTLDGSPKAFSHDLVKYDYPLQACIEMTGCLRSGLMPQVDNYFWLVVEKEPPYNATLYEFAEEDISYCMDELHYLLGKIKRAFDENLFPGYTDRADNQYGILKAEIPMWYRLASL